MSILRVLAPCHNPAFDGLTQKHTHVPGNCAQLRFYQLDKNPIQLQMIDHSIVNNHCIILREDQRRLTMVHQRNPQDSGRRAFILKECVQ